MKNFAVIDAETDPFKFFCFPEPFLWGYYNGDEYLQFTSTDDLIDFISERDEVIYAHNGGKFDFHFLFRHVEIYEPLKVINGRIAICHIGKAELRDSWIMLPVPLGAYQKDDIDYDKFTIDERHKEENWLEICNYLQSDCLYLYDLIKQFFERYDESLTMAGASVKQWQKLSGRKAPRSPRSFYELLSKYYYGGRVQCFKTGVFDTSFKVIDINSAYPFAMLHKHPFSTEYEIVDKFPDDPDHANACMVEVEGVSYGALPWRDPDDGGKLKFPVGERHTYYVTGWEYFAALDTGALGSHKVKSIRTFEELIDFKVYINHFYEQRQRAKDRGDIAEDLFSKLFMNSLYGKFAANPDNYRQYEVIPLTEVEAAEEDGWELVGEMEGFAVMAAELDTKDKRFFNIATAASITGFVRAYLWRAISQCEGVIYCDTDSIAAESIGELPLGDELGQWKVELDCKRAAVAGKKLYAFQAVEPGKKLLTWHGRRPCDHGEYKIASKGVRLSPCEIFKVAKGDVVTYTPEVPTFSIGQQPRFVTRKVRKRG